MTKKEMKMNETSKIMDLLRKLNRGEFCTPNCYGCCGDQRLCFASCPDVAENFKNELAKLGYRRIAGNEVVVEKYKYEELKSIAKAYDNLPYIESNWGM